MFSEWKSHPVSLQNNYDLRIEVGLLTDELVDSFEEISQKLFLIELVINFFEPWGITVRNKEATETWGSTEDLDPIEMNR